MTCFLLMSNNRWSWLSVWFLSKSRFLRILKKDARTIEIVSIFVQPGQNAEKLLIHTGYSSCLLHSLLHSRF